MLFQIITPDVQRAYEHRARAFRAPDNTPLICGYYGRACRCMNSPDGANRCLCHGCPLVILAAENKKRVNGCDEIDYYLTPTKHEGNKPVRWGVFSYVPSAPYFGAGTDNLIKSYKYHKCALNALDRLLASKNKEVI